MSRHQLAQGFFAVRGRGKVEERLCDRGGFALSVTWRGHAARKNDCVRSSVLLWETANKTRFEVQKQKRGGGGIQSSGLRTESAGGDRVDYWAGGPGPQKTTDPRRGGGNGRGETRSGPGPKNESCRLRKKFFRKALGLLPLFHPQGGIPRSVFMVGGTPVRVPVLLPGGPNFQPSPALGTKGARNRAARFMVFCRPRSSFQCLLFGVWPAGCRGIEKKQNGDEWFAGGPLMPGGFSKAFCVCPKPNPADKGRISSTAPEHGKKPCWDCPGPPQPRARESFPGSMKALGYFPGGFVGPQGPRKVFGQTTLGPTPVEGKKKGTGSVFSRDEPLRPSPRRDRFHESVLQKPGAGENPLFFFS